MTTNYYIDYSTLYLGLISSTTPYDLSIHSDMTVGWIVANMGK